MIHGFYYPEVPTDKNWQVMAEDDFMCLREVGETGFCNDVHFVRTESSSKDRAWVRVNPQVYAALLKRLKT